MTGDDRSAFITGLFKHIRKVRSFDKVQAAITGSGKAAPMVRDASLSFPDSWVKSANDLGSLHTRYGRGRGFHITLGERYDGKRVRVGGGFGVHNTSTGEGFIKAGNPATALHEYVHRLQSALPGIDKIFQDEHRARTKGDKLKRLRDVTGISYRYDEVTREDHYVTPYVGKEYGSGDAKEVMTMAFEYLLGGSEVNFEALYFIDRDMFDMTIGILENG